jgi:Flp pilus assembly protein TadD
MRRARANVLVVASLMTLAASANAQQATQSGSIPRGGTAEADAAYAAGDRDRAAREYEAVLATSPDNSRALYMLAQLRRNRTREAIALLERYVRLVPRDAWGHIALGEALGRAGRVTDAEARFDEAERLAPDERDVMVGRARMLSAAGRTDAAIAAYQHWLTHHANDAEAEREVSRQYRRAGRIRSAIRALQVAQRSSPDDRAAHELLMLRALHAPRVEPDAGLSIDSDQNSVWHTGGVAGLPVADALDLWRRNAPRDHGHDLRAARRRSARHLLASASDVASRGCGLADLRAR